MSNVPLTEDEVTGTGVILGKEFRIIKELRERLRDLQAKLEAAKTANKFAANAGLVLSDRLEAERKAHDATELRLEQTVAQLNHERKAREEAERQTSRVFGLRIAAELRADTAEAALADEKTMRAKNIWCCDQAEQRCKELEAALTKVFEDCEDELLELADHIQDNANKLAQWEFEKDEARCRELCSMYLREFVQNRRAIRALSPTGQPDDRTAAEQDLESSTAIYDQPCYTPETPVAVQASMSNFAPPAAAPIQAHSKSQYKCLVTQGADVAAPSGGQTASLTDSQESPAGEHLVAAAPIRHDIVGVKYPPTAAARIVQRADLPPQPATVLTTTAPYFHDPASALLDAWEKWRKSVLLPRDESDTERCAFFAGAAAATALPPASQYADGLERSARIEIEGRKAFQRDLESGIRKVVVESPTELQRLTGEKE